MKRKTENPYLASKLLWNDLYGDVESKLVRAQQHIFVLCGLLVLTILSLTVIAMKSRVQPYVAVLHGNELLTLNQFDQPKLTTLKPKLAALMSREFIKDLRGVSLDARVNRDRFIRALSMSSGAATGVVKDYHQRKINNIVHLQINSVILQSPQAMELRWLEVTRDSRTGDLLSRHHYAAELTFRFEKTSSNTLIAKHNPLGFYITSLAWSKDHVR